MTSRTKGLSQMKMDLEPYIYGLIGNIPAKYHSCDLRNFFSQFIESGGFNCFHYRHRPEQKVVLDGLGLRQQIGVPPYEGNPQSQNVNTPCVTNTSSSKKSAVHPNISCTKCCVVRLRRVQMERLIAMYNKKHWLDKNGDSIAQICLIARVTLNQDLNDTDRSTILSSDAGIMASVDSYKTRSEQRQIPKEREQFTLEDLNKLAELNPPDIMPNGNVGTPTKMFMDFIRDCKLPPGVIKKLGLTFPKIKNKRRYGNVPFDYGREVLDGAEDNVVFSADGHELCSELGKQKQKKKTKSKCKEDCDQDQEDTEPCSGSDDDTCEEWERHEALYDDPDNQERNKERLYEDKIELKWEKGGSGLVFYTDANFWQQQEGDFDEQTADDWDVDMSEYYEPGSGDMDARALVTMDREKRRRAGIVDPDDQIFSGRIGKFEAFTKGIGRKVLEKQGWKDGRGLGSKVEGITDALENEGQVPSCKRGFGYHGEQLNRHPVKKHRGEREVFIPTVYDKPVDLDQPETLLRRKTHYAIKHREEISYRDSIAFTKASCSNEKT